MRGNVTVGSFAMLCGVFLMVMLGGCNSKPDQESTQGITREASTEGLSVTLHVFAEEISTSEMLQVELVVSHAESHKVQLPEVLDKWGDFFVFESRTSPARLGDGGKVEIRRVYILEPDLPGESTLSGLLVKAIDDKGGKVDLTTEPIVVQVKSVLNTGETKMRDIAPNERVEPPKKLSRWPVAILITNVVLVLCMIIVWIRWKKVNKTVVDEAAREFEELKSAEASDVMMRLERTVCRVVAQRKKLPLVKADFAGLAEQLEKHGVQVTGLTSAVAEYEKLQYSSSPANENQVRALYAQFETVCKEVAS